MKAHPSCEFFIYGNTVYYNNRPVQSGSMTGVSGSTIVGAVTNVRNVPSGYISLYEYNIDRPYVNTDRYFGYDGTGSYTIKRNDEITSDGFATSLLNTGRIYPWISKDSAGSSFKTITTSDYATEYENGEVIVGEYPLSASIAREYITNPSSSLNKHFWSLKNKLNFYGIRSQHYVVSSSFGGDKNTQTLNLISIPSIFFGSQIKPGSLSLKWYVTGSLIGELRDKKQNGELIQVGPAGSEGSGSVAGVALYDEGFLLLTGSWNLYDTTMTLDNAGEHPSWIHYGVGANDSATPTDNVSFNLSFKGTSETQVMTMFAHAKRGEVNFSNNPSYLSYGQETLQYTSSVVYEENPSRTVVNIVSSSHSDFSASYERAVYISKVAVYDENKKLIGIATLADPILKEEMNDLTFKIKLDI